MNLTRATQPNTCRGCANLRGTACLPPAGRVLDALRWLEGDGQRADGPPCPVRVERRGEA